MKTIVTKMAQSFGIKSYPFEEKTKYYQQLLKVHGPDALLYQLRDAREAEDAQADIERAGGRGVDKDWNWRRDDVLTIVQVLMDNGIEVPPRSK